MQVEIILSGVLAICTLIYTGINFFMLLESRATRKQKTTPRIVPFLQRGESNRMLELHIKNIGEGLAKNVESRVLKDYNRFGKEDSFLSHIEFFTRPMQNFPPGYELKYYIHSMSDIYEKDKNGSIELEFTYEDCYRKKHREIFELSFNPVMQQNYSSPPETYLGQIPYYLKKINKNLEKININKNQ